MADVGDALRHTSTSAALTVGTINLINPSSVLRAKQSFFHQGSIQPFKKVLYKFKPKSIVTRPKTTSVKLIYVYTFTVRSHTIHRFL